METLLIPGAGIVEIAEGDTLLIPAAGLLYNPAVFTFDESLRNVVNITGLPLNELVRTCSANQARSLRLNDRGSIKQGLLADLTLLNLHSINRVPTLSRRERLRRGVR